MGGRGLWDYHGPRVCVVWLLRQCRLRCDVTHIPLYRLPIPPQGSFSLDGPAQRFVQAPNRTQRAPFQNCYWFSVNRKYFIISCICAQKQYVDFRSAAFTIHKRYLSIIYLSCLWYLYSNFSARSVLIPSLSCEIYVASECFCMWPRGFDTHRILNLFDWYLFLRQTSLCMRIHSRICCDYLG